MLIAVSDPNFQKWWGRTKNYKTKSKKTDDVAQLKYILLFQIITFLTWSQLDDLS